jgi:hypothetical protein
MTRHGSSYDGDFGVMELRARDILIYKGILIYWGTLLYKGIPIYIGASRYIGDPYI